MNFATMPAISRTMCSPISTSISRNTRQGAKPPAAMCTGPRRRGCPPHRARHLQEGQCPHGDQGQVDDHRGDRLNDSPRGQRHRAGGNRSRRIHHPVSRRTPSHIIAPAVHVNKEQVEADFRRVHTHLPKDRDLSEPASLLSEARAVLRQKYFEADVGITGANFLIAETGNRSSSPMRAMAT
jgi:hypothetical protein